MSRRRPQLRQDVTVLRDGGERVWIRRAGRTVSLRGAGLDQLLTYLDGRATVAELARGTGLGEADLTTWVTHLDRLGLLEPEVPVRSRTLARWLRDRGASDDALEGIADQTVAVAGPEIVGEALRRALEERGFGRLVALDTSAPALGSAGPNLAVVIDDPQFPDADRLDRWNRVAVERRIPWLLVTLPAGPDQPLCLGPFFLPDETACHACLVGRRASQNRDRAEVPTGHESVITGEAPAPFGATSTVAVALAADALLRHAAELEGALYGKVIEYRLERHESTPRPVLQLPRCPVCGPDATGRTTVRLFLESPEGAS